MLPYVICLERHTRSGINNALFAREEKRGEDQEQEGGTERQSENKSKQVSQI